MSSCSGPPPPPAPPAPALPAGVTSSSSLYLKGSSAFPLFKLQQNGNKSEIGSDCPLGHTETRDVTEEEFIKDISKLIASREGDFSLSSNQDEECKDTLFVVVLPLKKPILQNGPMCGIVALAEALQILKKGAHIDPKIILDEAITRGYSKQGEMFSIVEMQTLAEKFGNCQQSSAKPMQVHCLHELINNILMGRPALIPYDADYNHSPALRKGHAAHWAVIHGLANRISLSKLGLLAENPEFKVLMSSPQLTIVTPVLQCLDKDLVEMLITDSLHVIAHQGKSFRIGLWKYKDLIESNQNLKEMAPKILDNRRNTYLEILYMVYAQRFYF
ncbi:hypothetical protein Ocin01_19478 [Orchesella cincta]|uniref:Actin maturation protease n=1 Tax=Orchesella cincta TaxID=48709 RepID=A0A1D2M2R0_ORCCI|nr:hypothetical protein Ocin01_19478 [Orchesella cincta]